MLLNILFDPEEMLMVGDRSYDIVGGKKNGILTAAVRYGYGSEMELAASKPDFIFDTISDLTAFVRSAVAPETALQRFLDH